MRLLIPVFIAGLAFGQQSADIKTTGACSPVASGNNNTVRIDCGIGQVQGKKLLDIVNKILAGQATLDDIKNDVQALRSEVAQLPKNGTAIQVGDINVQPGGILSVGQTGGFTGQLIVPKKPARRIPVAMQEQIVSELAAAPGQVSISSFVGDTEAYALAKDLLDVFDRAKWTFTNNKRISSYTISGEPWTGIKAEMYMNGKAGEEAHLEGWRDLGTGVLLGLSTYLKFEFKVEIIASDSDHELTIFVGPQAP